MGESSFAHAFLVLVLMQDQRQLHPLSHHWIFMYSHAADHSAAAAAAATATAAAKARAPASKTTKQPTINYSFGFSDRSPL